MLIPEMPRTGWFESSDPALDYRSLKRIADRSAVGDDDRVELFDLIGLEDDFRDGQYPWRDYYLGFIDGGDRSDRAKNAIHDLNSYLGALRAYERSHGNLGNLISVRFHQTDRRIDRIEYVERPSPPSNIA